MMANKVVRTFSFAIPVLMVGYLLSVFALAGYMKSRPFVEKLGYIPTVNTMKVMAGDHKQFMGANLLLKVLFYYGGLAEKAENQLHIPADYPAMSRTIHAALKLDPYNMDGYYFAQAILTWDLGKAALANEFLEYGMKYRDWDWYLPFYAGFNYAYFLKDHDNAARHYRRAAELSGQALFMNLAGRYMRESGRTDMAIAYLDAMAKGARQESIKKVLNTRKAAFIAARKIELARDAYREKHGRLPGSVEDLLAGGYLKQVPQDPYGGRFYLAADGNVASTSGFSFAGAGK
ncbi:hypothetical protein [Geobacter argillaceus]|uniref:Tetratricopeptide repeat protein n=1 Tax=Geobacter argillaceus TaxID=345631 RepID=A0A562VNM8_9BACT|nr:hypothetical protein [Geobacter argillaceus]TWJ19381.1 hypothetical protein JN12_01797 [Geobacter argillaceus]